MRLYNLFIISVILSLVACTPKVTQKINEAPQEADFKVKGKPIMTFDRVFHDFGMVKKGEKKETVFNFTNTGNVDLEIEIVTSCECTTLDYPRMPIPPGESGKIDVLFDSSSKDEKELMVVTIILKNENPENGYPIVEEVKYTFDIEK